MHLIIPTVFILTALLSPGAGRKGAERESLAGTVCGSKLSKQSSRVVPAAFTQSSNACLVPALLKKIGSASASLLAPFFHHRWKCSIGVKAQGYSYTYPNSPLKFQATGHFSCSFTSH